MMVRARRLREKEGWPLSRVHFFVSGVLEGRHPALFMGKCYTSCYWW